MTPRVKVCGIRRVEDALLACELGAAAVGFVFWPRSPRFIEPTAARAIVEALCPFVMPVGVFVNQPPDYVAEVAAFVRLGAAQLHGDEPPAMYPAFSGRVIKAVAVTGEFDPARACDEVPRTATMLLDAADPLRRGGTGRTVDWGMAAAAARLRPIILSGGLTPANVADAVERVRPFAVDVSSGVESSPGVKDHDRLQAFLTAVAAVHTRG